MWPWLKGTIILWTLSLSLFIHEEVHNKTYKMAYVTTKDSHGLVAYLSSR